MIVERKKIRTRQFCEQATADFTKEDRAKFEFPHAYRIYLPITGPENVVYLEIEFEDFEEREAFWAAFFARSEMPELIEKWNELTESGGSTELLRLVE